jgi:GDPmannose 4,6-dehydratase
MKIGLVTGITGQDGSYLAELLIEKGYIVYGIIRRTSSDILPRISHISNKIHLRQGDLSDGNSISNILFEINELYPCFERLEIYNLAAMSHVRDSFELSEYVGDIDGLGTLRILNAIKKMGDTFLKKTRFYQASTSEMFGNNGTSNYITEQTPFYPRSPYGVGKLYAHCITRNYRESYNMFACSGILFNHESPRRGPTFVTRKITIGLNKILKGEQEFISLGNIYAKRDWGHAKDYVYGMWLMLQTDVPEDYILASGETHSVKEFIEKAFSIKNFSIKWRGDGINEEGYDENTGKVLIKIDPKFFRPAEIDILLGDSSYAREKLGWCPQHNFDSLVKEMVDSDCSI